jgi:hypothetical protein
MPPEQVRVHTPSLSLSLSLFLSVYVYVRLYVLLSFILTMCDMVCFGACVCVYVCVCVCVGCAQGHSGHAAKEQALAFSPLSPLARLQWPHTPTHRTVPLISIICY